MKANKGEWSELYAFVKLLKEGKIYAADENVERIENIFFPIMKLYREEVAGSSVEYQTGEKIRIYKNGSLITELDASELIEPTSKLYKEITERKSSDKGAFEIDSADAIMQKMSITKVKAPSADKSDIKMRIHDIHTGYESDVGFSIKSDLGNPPTLLNAGSNTNFVYEIFGIDDAKMHEINSIDKSVSKTYMIDRMDKLFELASDVKFSKMSDETYESNLMMIDSMFPEIYGDFILNHYKHLSESISSCIELCNLLVESNPLGIRNPEVFYKYKFKKMLCASALGMTPGKNWNGIDDASGGYIIVKRDGDVLCYHLYNRNFFEEYLLRNTQVDRPSASRYDYAYVFKENNRYFIRFNVQIRFKSISSSSTNDRLMAYFTKLNNK